MQPLSGLKAIELARILAGPWAGQTLADLGAEVIKVEVSTGDDTRQWGHHLLTKTTSVVPRISTAVIAASNQWLSIFAHPKAKHSCAA